MDAELEKNKLFSRVAKDFFYTQNAFWVLREVVTENEEDSYEKTPLLQSANIFFSITALSLESTCIIGILKLFDKNKESLSLYKLASLFKKDGYIEQEIKEKKDIIRHLKEIRDKRFAHISIKPFNVKEYNHNLKEIEEMITFTRSIFNKLAQDSVGHRYLFESSEEDAKRDTQFILEALEQRYKHLKARKDN